MATIVIMFNQADTSSGLYPVQLWHEGKPLAEAVVRLDRQRLLERERKYSPHEYKMELYSAVPAGKVGEEYQRLVGRVRDKLVRVQPVIAVKAGNLNALP